MRSIGAVPLSPKDVLVLAFLSSPIRRWLLATLLVPVLAWALARIGLFLQRRNGGAPTRVSRALLSVSAFARRHGASHQQDDEAVPAPPLRSAERAATNGAASRG